ncbi:malonyl-CoA decarboxylase [Pseudogemmobacter sp. W21_MBD1_M6]|uniref:malonyl-CoA decarboxylase n=1 Tax=Pseudogemmobacter sp. W21_MBD1_M6 TaxID=3240271 RepID=UPI003F9CA730
MTRLTDLLSTLFERRYFSEPTKGRRPIEAMCHDLLTSRGDVSGMQLARMILDRFEALEDAGRLAFFQFLTRDMDVDPAAVAQAATEYGADRNKATYSALLRIAEAPRQELARRLNQVPGATARLVAMRTDLLRFAKDDPALLRTDQDFQHLFSSWFNRGFLVLRRINWDTPASVLERIIAYEAVHAIDSWDDLRRRLQPEDRRCYAFFHPAMPDDPLIFVEVALAKGIPGSIQAVLAEERAPVRATDADTAVFYSISNCQSGLAGISFGNSLIKQVVADLSRDLPHLKTFVTLSPIPGLGRWMDGQDDERITALRYAARQGDTKKLTAEADPLRAIAAHYLLEAKRDNGLPADPVARFHLNNGALVHEIHAMADTSANGLNASCGAMVNYLYDSNRIEENHEDFASTRKVVASKPVQALARTARTTGMTAAKAGDKTRTPSNA